MSRSSINPLFFTRATKKRIIVTTVPKEPVASEFFMAKRPKLSKKRRSVLDEVSTWMDGEEHA